MTERQKIILDNMYLARIVAAKIYNQICRRIDYEDLLSYAYIGLIDAVDKYKSTNNTKFSTYAGVRIKGYVLDEIRKLDILSRKQRKEVKIGQKEDVIIYQYEQCYNIGIPFDDKEDMLDLKQSIKNLSLIERKLVYYRYIKDLPFDKISKKINKAYSTTIKIHKRAIERLRGEIE